MVVEINDKNYEKMIKDNSKVVIDCYANWCGPCKMLSPVLEDLASELTDIKFFKVNVDESEVITSKYQIMSIPTLLIFENGTLKNTVVGLRSKSELKDLISE